MWSQKQYELDEWKQINNELEKNTVYVGWNKTKIVKM